MSDKVSASYRLLGLLALAATSIAQAAPVQVLLQGPDPQALHNALLQHGGTMTHELPLIHGIGGEVKAEVLDALERSPGVNRLIEDFNPITEPEQRECALAGDLDISIEDGTLRWRVHNFTEEPISVKAVSVALPSSVKVASAQLTMASGQLAIGDFAPGVSRQPVNIDIPPGVSIFALSLPGMASWQGIGQNDLSITLETNDCSAALPKAYDDNHGDFYYPTVIGADLLHDAGITGRGINIAVIDSGLWDVRSLTSDTLGNYRVVANYNAIQDSESSTLRDLGGHGSHMTSIIANSDRVTRAGAIGYKGIAPNAGLIPVTAFAPMGDGDFLDIVRGIQWVVTNRERYDIRILNLSLSAKPRFKYWDDPINQAVLKAWQAGIVVVAAAGNDGPDWGTVGSPGNNPYVITVGAVTDSWTAADSRDDYIPDFSSRGPTDTGHVKPDVVAPGGHMTGLIPPSSQLALDNPNFILKTGEFVSTGSSQAAAVVSGVAALLLEARPELSNDDIKCLIKTSAKPAIHRDGRLGYSPFTQGEGYIDAARALTIGETQCDQQGLDINAAVAGAEQLYGPALRLDDGSPSLPGLVNLLTQEATEKGFSANRRWGIKAHLERLQPDSEPAQAPDVPADWGALYARERDAIRSLSNAEDNKQER